jgi:NADP-dependent 3-hydroxy acid dehydrogenase YdfG
MKTAIICGHTSGLGYEVSKKFLDAGYQVVGVARRVSDISSDKLVNIQADLARKDDIDRVTRRIKEKYDSFDSFIFCAGMLTAHEIDNLNYSEMEHMYQVNLFAPMVMESSLFALIKANGADVVNVTSDAIFNFYPKYHEYASAKTALQKFTSDLQRSLQDTAARVIDFCPSGFQSNIRKTGTGDIVVRDESTYMKVEDLANLMFYLLQLPKKIEIINININKK